MTAQLHRDGVRVNHKRVSRIMRENELTCKIKRRFVRTTDSDHSLPVYPNLLSDIAVTGPNQVWAGDITYVRLPVGFCYLAVLLYLYSRVVVGYAMSLRINAELCLAALWSANSTMLSLRRMIYCCRVMVILLWLKQLFKIILTGRP